MTKLPDLTVGIWDTTTLPGSLLTEVGIWGTATLPGSLPAEVGVQVPLHKSLPTGVGIWGTATLPYLEVSLLG